MSNPIERVREKARVGCPFCWEWIPTPKTVFEAFSADGCLGGRCSCGAAFVVDETGRAGGQALLDAQALVCDGDLDRALKLSSGADYDVQTRPYHGPTATVAGRRRGHGYMQPKVWFIKLKGEESAK
jgi:hypothetical protein